LKAIGDHFIALVEGDCSTRSEVDASERKSTHEVVMKRGGGDARWKGQSVLKVELLGGCQNIKASRAPTYSLKEYLKKGGLMRGTESFTVSVRSESMDEDEDTDPWTKKIEEGEVIAGSGVLGGDLLNHRGELPIGGG